jgi:hypothetical protein
MYAIKVIVLRTARIKPTALKHQVFKYVKTG